MRRLSVGLATALFDGVYLLAWPRVAAVASPLALLLGLAFGALHPGYRIAFSESLPLLVLMVVLGTVSGHLGVLFLAGYAFGDFSLAAGEWAAGALVYFWTQSVPLLIRPLFTWREVSIPVVAIASIQERGVILAGIGVLASVVRMALQGMTAYLRAYQMPLDAVQAYVQDARPVISLGERLPPGVVALGRALATILLLAGIYESWPDAALLGTLILLIAAARIRLLPVPLGRWPELIGAVPLLVRLVAAFLLIFGLAQLLEPQLSVSQTFRPLVILAGISLVVYYLLSPLSPGAGPAGRMSGTGGRTPPSPPPPPPWRPRVPLPVLLLVLAGVVALALAVPEVAESMCMTDREAMEAKLVEVLAGIDFGRRYYAYHEACRDRRPMASYRKEDLQGALATVPLQFAYDARERFFAHTETHDGLELKLHARFPHSEAEFMLFVKTSQGYIGGPFQGLALEVEQWRDPAFTYEPPYPLIPFSNLDELRDAVHFGVSLFLDARQAVLGYGRWVA